MSLSILNVTFDCSDAASTASFWSELTNWPCSKEEMPGNPFWVVALSAAGASRLVFVHVSTRRPSRTGFTLISFLRMHHKIRKSTGYCPSVRGSLTTDARPRLVVGS